MARAWGIPPLDVAEPHLDRELIKQWSGQMMLAENWMPIRRAFDGTIVVATARVPDDERRAQIESALGETGPLRGGHVQPTSTGSCSTSSRREIADDAANTLFRRNPELSARVTFSRGQKIGLGVFGVILLVLLVFSPCRSSSG